ncbi:fimbrial protein [Dyella humi]|uniref:Type 1 fimbrial protein n=1 Tax=Dyella humi TaxID=1770547 RepID=A0ABW8IL99_9GAMM
MKYAVFASPLTRRVAALLLAVGLLSPTICSAFIIKTASGGKTVHAQVLAAQVAGGQAPACSASTTSAAISLPSTISIAPGTANGLIGSAASVTVNVDCYTAFALTPNYYDDFTVLAGQLAAIDSTNASPSGSGIMFQTNVPGIDVLLTATPTQASSGSNGPNGTTGWAIQTSDCTSAGGTRNNPGSCSPNPITAKFTAQLVKTGPVSPGTISSIQLLQLFDSDFVPPNPPGNGSTTTYSSASVSFSTVTLNAITVSMSTCNVVAGSSNLSVALPTIVSNALPTTGSVAGQKAFNIQYTCPSGWALYMTMSTANPGTATGVIMPSASCSAGSPASNVGIQLLQSNRQAVTFNTAQSVGNSPNGTLNLTYYAQYYATGSPIGAGQVCGTATFTMSYQ